MELRPYQREALQAVESYLWKTDRHGVVSMPTGSGKTVVFAALLKEWIQRWPGTRAVILAHRYELLEQAERKLRTVWPEAPVGIWSAGLKRKELEAPVLIAGIQTAYKHASELAPNVAVIDEAHLVPNSKETMYRRFLDEAGKRNPKLRCFGFTATPFRLDGGPLCGEDRFFQDVIFEAEIQKLIENGYLCPLSTKGTNTVLEAVGVHTRGGDFIQHELARAVDHHDLVVGAVQEIISKGQGRKSWLIFCCGVEHAKHVSETLNGYGFEAPVIVGTTKTEERSEILRAFDAGELRAVVNVNCLTTGLDVQRIDLIAVLRPTQSTSLWVQMVGRGLRPHPDKSDCLVLDFGANAYRHGPLNNLQIRTPGDRTGQAPVKECPGCEEMLPAGVAICPECGHEFPKRKVVHATTASRVPVVGQQIVEHRVSRVSIARHDKAGKPPSLKVTYRCGLRLFSEWICLEHRGFAQSKAESWWRARFGHPVPTSVDDVVIHGEGTAERLTEITKAIVVDHSGKFPSILRYVMNWKEAAI